MLTAERAYEVASQWGSYIHATDIGACFYGFFLKDGRPVSEEHRTACLAYTIALLEAVRARRARFFEVRHTAHGAEQYRDALQSAAELVDLFLWFMACDLRPVH